MAEITIRPLAATDREAWTPLWHGYLTFYKATLPPEIDAITFGRLTGGEEPMGGFLAFQGDNADFAYRERRFHLMVSARFI